MNGHICYFFVIFLYIEKKWLLVRHLATVLPLKSILFGKFQRVNMKIDASKCWKIVEFQKILIKMKDCNTFYEAQANFICLQNSKIVLWNKWLIFFVRFCWHWDFLPENLKIKKQLWWCPLERVDEYKNVACPK